MARQRNKKRQSKPKSSGVQGVGHQRQHSVATPPAEARLEDLELKAAPGNSGIQCSAMVESLKKYLNEQRVRDAGDQRAARLMWAGSTFTTFLYGVATSLVIALAITNSDGHNPPVSALFLAYVFIIYLCVDWLSRVYLPSSLDADERRGISEAGSHSIKILLEVSLLFCLVITFATALREVSEGEHVLRNGRTIYCLAAFLMLTFFWNLYILQRTMKSLSWYTFRYLSWNGRTSDCNYFKAYCPKIKNNIESLVKMLDHSKSHSSPSAKILTRSMDAVLGSLVCYGQFVANHFVWSPVLGAALLIMQHESDSSGRVIMTLLPFGSSYSGKGWILLVVPTIHILFSIVCSFIALSALKSFDDGSNDGKRFRKDGVNFIAKKMLYDAAWLIAILLIVLVARPYALILLGLYAILYLLSPFYNYDLSREPKAPSKTQESDSRTLNKCMSDFGSTIDVSCQTDQCHARKTICKMPFSYYGPLCIMITVLTYLSLSTLELFVFLFVESVVICIFLAYAASNNVVHNERT